MHQLDGLIQGQEAVHKAAIQKSQAAHSIAAARAPLIPEAWQVNAALLTSPFHTPAYIMLRLQLMFASVDIFLRLAIATMVESLPYLQMRSLKEIVC